MTQTRDTTIIQKENNTGSTTGKTNRNGTLNLSGWVKGWIWSVCDANN